jgi:hypothetical protein
MEAKMTRLDDCQYLLVSQLTDTLTNFADPCEQCRHDTIHRYVRGEQITPRLVWENVRGPVVQPPCGSVLLEDTVLDKNSSFALELVRHPYRGNAKQVIKGIGVVTCVYVPPLRDLCWRIDYRLSAPDGDGKSQLEHVQDMLTNMVYHKQLPFQAVFIDTGYATIDRMLGIASFPQFS